MFPPRLHCGKIIAYKLLRKRQYWALIIKRGQIVGVCHRGTGYIWYVYLNSKPPQWLDGQYSCVEDAFNAFVLFKEHRAGALKKRR